MRALGPVQACLGWILLARAVAEAWRLRRVTASAASVRGASLSAFPLLPYFSQHLEALFTPGWTSLAIAENKTDTAVDSARVMVDLLAVKLRSSTALQIVSYDDEGGTADLRDGAARAVRCHLYKGEAQCDAAEIVASPGVTASLNNLLIAICEAGDGVLVPTPCYGAFPFDIEGSPSARNILVPCPLPPPLCVLTEAALEAAVRTHHAERSGAPRVAVLLLTSPSNPLGRVLSPAELAVAVRFCCARGMHLIADEIYAATAFANAPAVPGAAPCAQFVSARVIAERLAADDAEISAWAERQLHVLWGLSKDASSSGIRLGFCHSRSGAVQKAVGLANHFGGCSAFAQHAAAELLKDARQSADLFLRASRQLSQTAAFVCAKLKTLEPRITHVSPDAGMFVWCDLSAARRLRGGVVETEAELLDAIRTTCKLVLTPGRACLASEDGFVRICYAAVPRPELEAAIDRLVAFCQDRLAPDSKKQE
ncbi:pyridoxal phosphate-dependent transferase [Pelagophyceae sp. CCMP2097]|nr:pyridoxal phosphate-dependent transferase [Pelagophyceae sp. CCMP2097]